MRKSTKAMLLTTLVFPGAGHLVYRCWLRAGLIISLAVLLVAIYIRNSIVQAGIVVDKILNSEVDLDIMAIYKALHEGPESAGLLLLAISIYGLLFLWLIAAIDVYRIARKSTREKGSL